MQTIKEPFKIGVLVWYAKELRVYDFIKEEYLPTVNLQRKALRKAGFIGKRYPEKVKDLYFDISVLELLIREIFITSSELLNDVLDCISIITNWEYVYIKKGIEVLANLDRYELRRVVTPYTIVKRNNSKILSKEDCAYYNRQILINY